VSLLFLISFTYFFTLGGLSGMFNAHIGFDVMLHDTFYIVGHFHVMLAGAATSCIFAAFYFYFPAIFGVAYNEGLAFLHFIFYLCGQLLTFMPMLWLGYAGMPRRIMDYPAFFGGWHSIISAGHVLSIFAFALFLLMLVVSLYDGRSGLAYGAGVARLNTRLAFYKAQRRQHLVESA
jgi:cytochrome c oxidase subunit 1